MSRTLVGCERNTLKFNILNKQIMKQCCIGQAARIEEDITLEIETETEPIYICSNANCIKFHMSNIAISFSFNVWNSNFFLYNSKKGKGFRFRLCFVGISVMST